MDRLTPHRDATFDLDALCAAAGEILAGTTPADARAAAIPDARTVRWYQSSGLVDRPVRYAGRTAVYAYRHLLQIVAVKGLQAQGHSLAQIQRALAGVTTEGLEAAVLGELAHPPAPPPPAMSRPLVAAEVAPGVFVTIDPSRVADADAVLTAITRALRPIGAQS